MKITTQSSYSFYSKDINDVKYEKFTNKALCINEFKNKLSEYVASNMFKILNYSKFDFIKKFGKHSGNIFKPNSVIRGN